MGKRVRRASASVASGHGVSYRVKYLQLLVRQCSDEALAAVHLSLAQYVVLRELGAEPGLRSAELARRCFITRQSIRDVLTSLMDRHLVVDTAAASGRAGPLMLSDEGDEASNSGALVMRDLEERMLEGLQPAERGELASLLDRCVANLRRG